MIRQSISLTSPNDDWLKTLLDSEEYSSKSEIVNDLIRRARERQGEIHAIRSHLINAENSGFSTKTPQDMLEGFKQKSPQQ